MQQLTINNYLGTYGIYQDYKIKHIYKIFTIMIKNDDGVHNHNVGSVGTENLETKFSISTTISRMDIICYNIVDISITISIRYKIYKLFIKG